MVSSFLKQGLWSLLPLMERYFCHGPEKAFFRNVHSTKVLKRLQLCFFKAFPQKAAFFHSRNLFSPSSSFLTLSVYLEKFCISPKIKMQLPYFCIFHDAKLTDYFTQTFYFPSSEDRVFWQSSRFSLPNKSVFNGLYRVLRKDLQKNALNYLIFLFFSRMWALVKNMKKSVQILALMNTQLKILSIPITRTKIVIRTSLLVSIIFFVCIFALLKK